MIGFAQQFEKVGIYFSFFLCYNRLKENIMAKYDESYFNFDKDENITIDSLVGEDETILWRGKPNKTAFVMASVIKMLPIAVLWLAVDGTMIGFMIKFMGSLPVGAIIGICAFFLIHLAPVWIWIYNVVTASRRHKNIEYAFTNKRIIIRSGLIGIDIGNIYYSDIQSVNVRVGLIDKMLKVGDIYIKSALTSQAGSTSHSLGSYVLWDLPNPHALGNRLQKIALDIKTDINYPNALRPEENPGFNTKYAPKDNNGDNI